MNQSKTMGDMATDPSEINSKEDVRELFGYLKSYEDFENHMEGMTKSVKSFNVVSVVKYIVLLYSEDSFLNQNPPLTLEERQRSAVRISGLPMNDSKVITIVETQVVDLGDESIFKFIFEYLVREKKHLWQEIVSLETNMLENQKLRMKPVSDDSMSDFVKKDPLIKMYKVWRKQLHEYYDEFYGQNVNVRAIHKMNRESMAVIENYATL